MRLCLITLAVVGLSLAVAHAQDGAKSDQERIQGTWQVHSDEDGGHKAPAEALKGIKWVITVDKITNKVGDTSFETTYKLDPSKKPKWIDVTRGKRTTLGIYELEGDNLKICLPSPRSGKRSTAFESNPTSENEVLIVLEREEP